MSRQWDKPGERGNASKCSVVLYVYYDTTCEYRCVTTKFTHVMVDTIDRAEPCEVPRTRSICAPLDTVGCVNRVSKLDRVLPQKSDDAGV